MKSSLTFLRKIGFGLGHVYNDLCAGVWFSYTLLFMQGALRMPPPEAGALVMLGQIGDALATPLVGYLADKYSTKRRWHIFGSIMVFLSFPLIFSLCPMCSVMGRWWTPTYFGITILIFQFGWAMVQITHLAMIPEMSRTQKDRSDLTAIRYSTSVCSNVVVYIVTWAVLHARNKIDNNIGPDDAYRFRDISLILTLAGVCMTLLFHFTLSASGYDHRRTLTRAQRRQHQTFAEQQESGQSVAQINSRSIETHRDDEEAVQAILPAAFTSHNNQLATTSLPDTGPIRRKNFLKSPILYINALLYVFSRLFMTTSLVYMPLWLDERSWVPVSAAPISDSADNVAIYASDASVEHIATVPLVSFLSSFVSSIVLKYATRYIGHEMAYLLGSITSLGGCAWVAMSNARNSIYRLFGIAVMFGAGSSVTMISSLCITADMIGVHADQGGIIYSAVTFADKLITGIVVIVIEIMKCNDRIECPKYYQGVLAYGCGIAALLGLVTLFLLKVTKRCRRDRRRQLRGTQL